jgi:hypothetical protein
MRAEVIRIYLYHRGLGFPIRMSASSEITASPGIRYNVNPKEHVLRIDNHADVHMQLNTSLSIWSYTNGTLAQH